MFTWTTVIGLPLLWYPCLIIIYYTYSFIFLYHVVDEASKIK